MTRHFTVPAKLLLFGEYSILIGSSAISLPLHLFGSALKSGGPTPEAAQSNRELRQFHGFLANPGNGFPDIPLLERFRKELDEGLWLSSTIPERYGMGSSGAVTAAVFDRYITGRETFAGDVNGEDLQALRSRFAAMESFFHGTSSGFDPLVSYLDRPLQIQHNVISTVTFPGNADSGGSGLLLIDSGIPCSTGARVGDFLRHFAPGGAVTPDGRRLIQLTNTAIGQLLQGNHNALREAVRSLSGFQHETLSGLVPGHLHPCWREGLATGMFSLKLCGSGGGGFLLCFAHDLRATYAFFEKQQVPVTRVPIPWGEKKGPGNDLL